MANIQVDPSHYQSNYDTKERFCTYWHQIQEIISVSPKSILDVGIGNSFVSNYLRNQNFSICTLDIDIRLNPNVSGSVLSMPFLEGSFDVVSCCEVLEHIPFDLFKCVLKELNRVSKNFVLISLPDNSFSYRVNVQVPLLGEVKKLITLPTIFPPEHRFDGQHYWMLNKEGYLLQTVMCEMKKAGFSIVKVYRVFESPQHMFFLLKKE